MQIILLEESWRDLFLLSLAQWEIPLDVHHILECANVSKDNLPSDKMAAVLSDIRYIRDLIMRFREMPVDRTEYACLKAIVLFRAGEVSDTLFATVPVRDLIHIFACHTYILGRWLN